MVMVVGGAVGVREGKVDGRGGGGGLKAVKSFEAFEPTSMAVSVKRSTAERVRVRWSAGGREGGWMEMAGGIERLRMYRESIPM